MNHGESSPASWPVLNLSLNVSKQMRQERIVKDRRCFDIRNATSALIDDVEHVFFAYAIFLGK
jgi:hypothetical protein